MSGRRLIKKAALITLFSLLKAEAALATAYAWNLMGGGVWTDSASWTANSGFPNSSSDTASFGPIPLLPSMANPIISLNQNITLSSLSSSLTNSANGMIIQSGVGSSSLTISSNITSSNTNAFTITAPIVLPGGSTISITQSAPSSALTLNGNISEALPGSGLTFNGTTNSVLGGTNTYTGTTTINSGAGLTINGTLNSASNLVVNGTLNVSTSTPPLTVTNFSGTNTNATVFLTQPLVVGGTASTSFAGKLENAGSFTKTGSGTLTFSNANTYTGATIINNGTLALSASGGITPSSSLSLNGGTSVFDIHLTTSGATIGSLSGVSGSNILMMAKSLTINQNSAGTFGGTFTGGTAGLLNLNGSNTLTLTNVNTTFTGRININSGTLALSGSAALSSSSAVAVVGTFDISQASSPISIGSLTDLSSGTINLGAQSLTVNQTSTASYLGTINDGGIGGGVGGSLIKAGASQLTLTGINTYTGGTKISAGTLSIGSESNIGGASSGTVTFSGSSTLQFNAPLTISHAPFVINSGITGTIDTDGFNSTISSAISGTGGILKKISLGTLTLSGANTYTGGTILQAGTLSIGSESNIGGASSGSLTFLGNSTLQFNAPLTLSHAPLVINNGITGTIDTAGNNSTISTVISGVGGSLQKIGAGILTLSGTDSYTGGTTITTGTLAIGTGGSLSTSGSVSIAAGATFDISAQSTRIGDLSGSGFVSLGSKVLTLGTSTPTTTYSGIIQDGGISGGVGGSLVKQGTGALVLSGINTYTGGTTISNGTLAIGTGGSLFPSGSVSIGSTGVFDISAQSTTIGDLSGSGFVSLGSKVLTFGTNTPSVTYSGIIQGGGSLVKQGLGTVILSGNSSYSGGTTLAAGTLSIGSEANIGGVNAGTFTFSGNSTLLLNAPLTISHAPIVINSGVTGTIDTDGNNSTISTMISGQGALTKINSGALTLLGTNTYSGGTLIAGGSLIINYDTALGDPSTLLTFNGGDLTILNSTTSSRPFLFDTSPILTIIGTTDYSGIMSGPGGFTKSGSGTLRIESSSTFTGNSVVAAGTLFVDGNISSSPTTTVLSGATLSGYGTLNDVVNNGIVAPGDPSLPGHLIGTLSAHNFLFNGGSKYEVEIVGNASDLIVATDTITIISGATLHVMEAIPTQDVYLIAHADTAITGSFYPVMCPPSRVMYKVIQDPRNIYLSLNLMPFIDILPKGNLRNMAVCFDQIESLGLFSRDLLNSLNTMTMSSVVESFEQFDPSIYNSVNLAEQNIAGSFFQIFNHHLLNLDHNSLMTCSCLDLWATPFYTHSRQDSLGSTTALNGYQQNQGGILSGIDYWLRDGLFISAAAGYSNSDLRWLDKRTKGWINSYGGMTSMTWKTSRLILDGGFSYFYHKAGTKNFIQLESDLLNVIPPLIYDVPSCVDNDAHSYAFNGEVVFDLWRVDKECFSCIVWPYANAQYIKLTQSRFEVRSGPDLSMLLLDKSYDMWSSDVGLGCSLIRYCNDYRWSLDLSLGYRQETRIAGATTEAQFALLPTCTFDVTGLSPNNHLLAPKVIFGLDSNCYPLSLFFNYSGGYGHHFKQSQFSLEMIYSF